MTLLVEAQLHYARQDFDLAREMLARVQPVLAGSGSWQRRLMASWLRAEIERGLGNYALSKIIAEQTLAEGEQHEQPQVIQRCETTLGLLAACDGDHGSAENHFRRAIAQTESMRAPLPGEEFRSSFLSNKLVPYQGLLKVCLASGPSRWPEEAFLVAESARSRALAEKINGNLKALTKPRDDFEAGLMREMVVLTEELNYIYNQLDRSRSPGSSKETESSKLRKEVHDRERRLLEASRHLQHRNEGQLTETQSLDLPALQKELGVDTALVEYARIDDELIAFVVTNQRVEVVRNLASVAQVASAVTQFRFQIDTLRFGAGTIANT